MTPDGKSLLLPKPGAAALALQCPVPQDSPSEGLTHLLCALGACSKCGTLSRPKAEAETWPGAPDLTFFRCEVRATCSRCGTLPEGTKPVKADKKELCPICEEGPEDGRKGKFRWRTELRQRAEELEIFWNQHHLP